VKASPPSPPTPQGRLELTAGAYERLLQMQAELRAQPQTGEVRKKLHDVETLLMLRPAQH
jgi:hypothetical protein